MTIRRISDELWPDIMRIQLEAYDRIEPESLEVMRGKWLHSPEYCFVYRESGGHVVAYLLAHAWTGMQPPALHCPLPPESRGDILFLHDLSISPRLTGAGIGRQLVQCVLERAMADGLHAALLVSIQNSAGFWQKMGFRPCGGAVDAAYGDAQVMFSILR